MAKNIFWLGAHPVEYLYPVSRESLREVIRVSTVASQLTAVSRLMMTSCSFPAGKVNLCIPDRVAAVISAVTS